MTDDMKPKHDPDEVVDMFLLSNLRSRDSGLVGAILWIAAGEFAGADRQHGPRLMVVLGDQISTDGLVDAVSVRLTDPPEVLGELPGEITRQVVEFVNQNRGSLLQHWNGEISTQETLDLLTKV